MSNVELDDMEDVGYYSIGPYLMLYSLVMLLLMRHPNPIPTLAIQMTTSHYFYLLYSNRVYKDPYTQPKVYAFKSKQWCM